jgi:hypothetical protein
MNSTILYSMVGYKATPQCYVTGNSNCITHITYNAYSKAT